MKYVHTQTQREFDILFSELKYQKIFSWDRYKENTCVDLYSLFCKDFQQLSRSGESIISFDSWMKQTSSKIRFLPTHISRRNIWDFPVIDYPCVIPREDIKKSIDILNSANFFFTIKKSHINNGTFEIEYNK